MGSSLTESERLNPTELATCLRLGHYLGADKAGKRKLCAHTATQAGFDFEQVKN
jgi:hypothetical protein